MACRCSTPRLWLGKGVGCVDLSCTKNIYDLCLQLLEEASADAVWPLWVDACLRYLCLCVDVCPRESTNLSSYRLVPFLRICCCSCTASRCWTIFLAFSKVNSGSNCRRSDSVLSRILTRRRSQIRSSFRSP